MKTGLTFDDVLLVPQYSEILPSEVNISTYQKYKVERAYRECGNGHRNRIGYGNSYGT